MLNVRELCSRTFCFLERLFMFSKDVIIDCDPGIDDSLALLYALKHPNLNVVAITIVEGNVPVDIGLQNAILLLEKTSYLHIPIYLGQGKPLVRDFVSAQDTHGMDGLGESKLVPSVTKTAQKESADQFLANYFSNPKETSIIALGPLTNIAQALSRNSKLGKHCHRFVSMGGSFKSHGNCSPVAEYNYWCDPHAADKVFQDLGRKVEMVGLDVTRQIVLDPNRVAYMSRINPEMTAFISAITAFYNDFHWQYEHLIGCVINDPLALAYFLEPSICQGFDSYTEIVTQGPAMGQSIVDQADFYQKKANSHVLTRVETSLFWEDFMATILEAPHHHIRQDIDTLKLG